MRIRRTGNDDTRNGAVTQGRIDVYDLGSGLVCECIGRRAVRINDIFERQLRLCRGVACMNLPNPTRTKDRNVEHCHSSNLNRSALDRTIFPAEYNETLTTRCVSSLNLTDKTIDLIAIGRSSGAFYGE